MAKRRGPLTGEGTNSDGRSYTWAVVGFGQLRGGGRWYGTADYDVSPTDATIQRHISDPNWGMVVRVTYSDGTTTHLTIIGGYRPHALPGVIDLMVEDYG